MKVDARVDRIVGRSILPCPDVRNRMVGINVAPRRILGESDTAMIHGYPERKLVRSAVYRCHQRHLRGKSIVVLPFEGIDGIAIAAFIGVVLQESVRDTTPFWKGCIGRCGSAGWKTGVSRSRESCLLGGVGLEDIIAGRVVVVVRISDLSANIAVPRIAAEIPRSIECVAQRQIERWRPVAGDIGKGVPAGIVGCEQPVILQCVRAQGVVGIAGRERKVALACPPAQFHKSLFDIGRRSDAPARFVKAIARQKPVKASRLAASIFTLNLFTSARAIGRRNGSTGIADAVFRPHRQRSAERIQAEERVGAGHQGDFRNRVFWK